MIAADDARWMGAAAALAERGVGRTWPNPAVGCVIVKDGGVVGRGWTQPGGRPHAEAMALAQAGAAAAGADIFVTLEPCAHESPRGAACADLIVAARPARAIVALVDPDPRTHGRGLDRLRAAGIAVATGAGAEPARRTMAGFFTRRAHGRPHVTLKLALSLDGAMATGDGRSRWITGAAARADAHLERARHDLILVGRGTYEADAPRLDVRLPGLADRAPARVLLGHGAAPEGWLAIAAPHDIASLPGDLLMVEGGARTAAAFLHLDLVDRLLLYRAPIVVGGGATLPDIGLADLADAHRRWRLTDSRLLGSDRRDVYERVRN